MRFAPRSILCYVAPGEGYSDGVHRAALEARRSGASLTLLGVVEPLPRLLAQLTRGVARLGDLLRARQSEELEALAHDMRRQDLAADWVLREGRPADEIVRQVVEHEHDLVFKLAQGEGGQVLGSTARQLVRKCPCAVWIVKPGPRRRRHVVAAVDPQGDVELQRRILGAARDVARGLGARLSLVHAWELPSAHLLAARMQPDDYAQLVEAIRSDARERLDLLLANTEGALADERVELLEGHHAPALLEFLREARGDLLVLGTLSRSGLAGLILGNTAERVLSSVDSSVLVLKPEGFVSPIVPRESMASQEVR